MKKYFLSLVAIVLGLSFSAFTMKSHSVRPNDQQIYYFFGTAASEESNPAFYNQMVINCSGTALRCKIQATPLASNPSEPDLSKPVTVLSTKN